MIVYDGKSWRKKELKIAISIHKTMRRELKHWIDGAKYAISMRKIEKASAKTMHKQMVAQKKLECMLDLIEYDHKNPKPTTHSWIVDSQLRYKRFNHLLKLAFAPGHLSDGFVARDRRKNGISVKINNNAKMNDRVREVCRMLADETVIQPPLPPDTYHGTAYYWAPERYLFYIAPKKGNKYEEHWKEFRTKRTKELSKARRKKAIGANVAVAKKIRSNSRKHA